MLLNRLVQWHRDKDVNVAVSSEIFELPRRTMEVYWRRLPFHNQEVCLVLRVAEPDIGQDSEQKRLSHECWALHYEHPVS